MSIRHPTKKVTVDGFLVGRHDPAAHDRPSLMDNPWDDDPRTNEDRALERFVVDMRMIAGRTPCGGSIVASSTFSTAEDMVTWFGAAVDKIDAAFRRRDEELARLRQIESDVEAMRRVLGIAPSAGGQ